MENIKLFITWLRLSGAAVCSVLVSVLGGWDLSLKILVTLTVLDFITGILTAIYSHTLSSEIGSKGIVKKIGIYIIVAVACLLDQLMNTNFALRGAAIGFYITVEGLSIIENWSKMDLPLPGIIKNALLQLQQKKEGGDGQ